MRKRQTALTEKWPEGVVSAAIWVMILVMTFGITAFAGSASGKKKTLLKQRVYDMAGIFSQAEEERLEDIAAQVSEESGMELVIASTEKTGGKTTEEYADDFYEQGGFGTGKDHSGAVFLIDMENRYYWISTEGRMTRYLTDSRIESVLDGDVAEYMADGRYGAAAEAFLKDTGSWIRKGIPGGQYIYDEETGKISVYRRITWYEGLFAFAVACGAGLLACRGVIKEYDLKEDPRARRNQDLAYRAEAAYALRPFTDQLIDQKVIRQAIPRSHPSGGRTGGSRPGRTTVHRSGSGRRHGGGGRRF